jgi:uncharacterized delta-60 repeat protein
MVVFQRAAKSPPVALAALAVSAAIAAVPAAAAQGDLDPSFGTGGKVVTGFGEHQSAKAEDVAILGNGKIVAAGSSSAASSGEDFTLARYLPDGSLDPVFAGDGTVTTDLGSGVERAYGVAVQADGKIVAAGFTGAGGRDGVGDNLALVRYRRDGGLDSSFGSGGVVVTNLGGLEVAFAVAVQADGKIVVAGQAVFPSLAARDFLVARFEPDGGLDESFGTGGIVTTDFGAAEWATAIALQPDGRILAAGDTAGEDFALARYLPGGGLDTSFDGDGRATTDFTGAHDGATGLAVQPDGKIVAAGWSWGGPGWDHAFALARYNPDGSLDARQGDWPLDTSFDVDGKVITTFPGSFEGAWDVAVQADLKIVAVGDVDPAPTYTFALARYAYDGSLDASFGSLGLVTTPFDTAAHAQAIAIQADGGIVAAGFAIGAGFALARYQGNPTPPPIVGVPAGIP